MEQATKLAIQQSRDGFLGFLHHIVIDSRPEPRLFREIGDKWQWGLMKKLAPAIEAVAGLNRGYNGPRRFWIGLPRGHDKTGAIGRTIAWLLSFSRRKVQCVAAAGDTEQASRLAHFMEDESEHNLWYKQFLEFNNRVVKGNPETGSRLQILSADAASSFGDKTDVCICDELTHWPNSDLWDALYSGSLKRPDSVYIIISNAGVLGTWQHKLLELAKRNAKSANPSWYVFEAPGPIASWMSEDGIKELEEQLPAPLYKRVIWNVWQDPSEGCGYITRSECQACEDLGRKLGLMTRVKGQPGVQYYASVDYGSTKDRCVLCVLHKEAYPIDESTVGTRVIVDRLDVIQGSQANRVSIAAVNQWIETQHEAFDAPVFVVDQYQMEATIQHYEPLGYRMNRFEPRGGKSNYEMAVNLHQLITQTNIAWPPGLATLFVENRTLGPGLHPHTLIDEFSELVTKPMVYGFRFDHERNKHDDRAVAVAMAALYAIQDARVTVDWNSGAWF